MPDYEVAIVIRILPIRADDDQQAEARAKQMLAWISYQPPEDQPWAKPWHPPEIAVEDVAFLP